MRSTSTETGNTLPFLSAPSHNASGLERKIIVTHSSLSCRRDTKHPTSRETTSWVTRHLSSSPSEIISATAGVTGVLCSVLIYLKNEKGGSDKVRDLGLIVPFYTYHAKQVYHHSFHFHSLISSRSPTCLGELPSTSAAKRTSHRTGMPSIVHSLKAMGSIYSSSPIQEIQEVLHLLHLTASRSTSCRMIQFELHHNHIVSENHMTRLTFTPGNLWARDDLEKLIEMTGKAGCLLLMDEIYCDLIWREGYWSPVQMDKLPKHVIVARGFAKR